MTVEYILSTREHLFYAACNKINVVADYLCYVAYDMIRYVAIVSLFTMLLCYGK